VALNLQRRELLEAPDDRQQRVFHLTASDRRAATIAYNNTGSTLRIYVLE
jgi:hypothetical protein